MTTRPKCPDDGTCHHECPSAAACFRVAWCGPFTGEYPGDDWPAGMTEAARRARGAHPLTVEEVIIGAYAPVTAEQEG